MPMVIHTYTDTYTVHDGNRPSVVTFGTCCICITHKESGQDQGILRGSLTFEQLLVFLERWSHLVEVAPLETTSSYILHILVVKKRQRHSRMKTKFA